MKGSVKLKYGSLVLQDDFTWSVEGWVSPESLDEANQVSNEFFRNYSPANGFPGRAVTLKVARVLGGKPILPELPPEDPNIVY